MFTNKYCLQIRESQIRLDFKITDILIQVSRFKNLEQLDLLILPNIEQNIDIYYYLKLIGKNCQKLRKFRVEFQSKVQLSEPFFNLFNNNFLILEKFEICSFSNFIGKIENLKCCERLSYLSLFIPKLYVSDLENIHLYLPQLKTLKLTVDNIILTEEIIQSIVQIKQLLFLVLAIKNNDNHENFSDDSFYNLIFNSNTINHFVLAQNTKITKRKLKLLIECAKLNPYNRYEFYFNGNIVPYGNENLPKNLKMI